MTLSVGRVATMVGEIRPPSDKSMTHRAYMLASLADGERCVLNPLQSEDCRATLKCLEQLGTKHDPNTIFTPASAVGDVRFTQPPTWQSPAKPLDCGNSGTTMRLLSGLIASHPIEATLLGDASLSKRPMTRIADPLRLMGATVNGDAPPLQIRGSQLKGIRYDS